MYKAQHLYLENVNITKNYFKKYHFVFYFFPQPRQIRTGYIDFSKLHGNIKKIEKYSNRSRRYLLISIRSHEGLNPRPRRRRIRPRRRPMRYINIFVRASPFKTPRVLFAIQIFRRPVIHTDVLVMHFGGGRWSVGYVDVLVIVVIVLFEQFVVQDI